MANRHPARWWWAGSGGLATCWWVWCDPWNRPDELHVKVPTAQRRAGQAAALPPVLILNLTEALLLFLIQFVFRKVRGKPAVPQSER